jgi:hypothetical protein
MGKTPGFPVQAKGQGLTYTVPVGRSHLYKHVTNIFITIMAVPAVLTASHPW